MKKGIIKLIVLMSVLIFVMGCVQANDNFWLNSFSQHDNDSPDWVKELPQAKNEAVNQIFIVAGMGMDNSTATISMHERDNGGNWKEYCQHQDLLEKRAFALKMIILKR